METNKKVMVFTGNWESNNKKNLIIHGPVNGDEYNFILNDSERETISIFISTREHARTISHASELKEDITIIDENTFIFRGEEWHRSSK